MMEESHHSNHVGWSMRLCDVQLNLVPLRSNFIFRELSKGFKHEAL